MDDCCALPAELPPEGAVGVREQIDLLRRFHLGDPSARPAAIGTATIPAALSRLRHAPAAGDWPLIVDPSAGQAPFVRSLGAWLGTEQTSAGRLGEQLGQLAQRISAGVDDSGARSAGAALLDAAAEVADDLGLAGEERAGALDAARSLATRLGTEAVLVGFGPRAVNTLGSLAARRRHARALTELSVIAADLTRSIDEILEGDQARRQAVSGDRRPTDQLGPLGSRLIDPARFSEVLAHRRTERTLTDARCQQLEAARELLATLAARSAPPIWLPEDGAAAELGRIDEASHRFDRAAEASIPLVRALRLARLEAAQAFEPDRHQPWLERLDWRSFDPLELALIPAVFVNLTVEQLLDRELPALTRLLLSGRPVEVVIERASNAPGDSAGFEPGLLGVVLGRAFVHQGSVAAGVALASGLEQALDAARPALHLLDAPLAGGDHGLDPWWVAWAGLAGRALPGFVHDPARGTSWASRFDLGINPALLDDWPEEALADELSAAGAPRTAPFTFADAALLDPAWKPHFAVAPPSAELVPFNAWIADQREQAPRGLPFVWGVTDDDRPLRLVISRELSRAALERLEFWRTLSELAGIRSDHIAATIAATRRQEEEQAATERSELATRHAQEIERLRHGGDTAAVERLVGALMGLGGGAPGESPAPIESKSDPEGGGIP